MTSSLSAMNNPCGGSNFVRSATSVSPRWPASRGSPGSSTSSDLSAPGCPMTQRRADKSGGGRGRSVEEVRLLAGDLRPERLEGEPARDLGADVVMRLLRHRRVDLHDGAG